MDGLVSGSGRVTFNNQHSYLKAVSAAFVEIKTTKFTKKVTKHTLCMDSLLPVAIGNCGSAVFSAMLAVGDAAPWQHCQSGNRDDYQASLMRVGGSPAGVLE